MVALVAVALHMVHQIPFSAKRLLTLAALKGFLAAVHAKMLLKRLPRGHYFAAVGVGALVGLQLYGLSARPIGVFFLLWGIQKFGIPICYYLGRFPYFMLFN